MKKAPGILPSVTWLQTNGWFNLTVMMLKYPEAFAHIEQNKRHRTPEEWVPIAEKMAEQNGETLPLATTIYKNGNTGLWRAMRIRPDLFAHIPQDQWKHRTVDEWVAIADGFVKQEGHIPCVSWLETNGYIGLNRALTTHPDRFAHLRQDYQGGRTAAKWVIVAEQLVREHGSLPCGKWLSANGYGGLDQVRYRYPEMFAHLQQDKLKGRRVEEWVPIAEELARQHGHVPNKRWLNENGYIGLRGALAKYPAHFAHLKRDVKKRRTPQDWATLSKQLVKEHGKLPTQDWLNSHGYAGLLHAKRNHPRLFAHLKP